MANQRQTDFSVEAMEILSILLLSPLEDADRFPMRLQRLDESEFASLVAMAHSNHVVVRGLEVYCSLTQSIQHGECSSVAQNILAAERSRIAKALDFLEAIFAAFRQADLDVTVIKSLDHWPDFGSDIDLYTNGEPTAVVDLMERQFEAKVMARSWGDRLAGKWNFQIPGLPEAVEIHMCRLGQTGEQLRLARGIPARSRVLHFDGRPFRVASASDRLMISTLQRMYRHFYFRLCDIVDSASLVLGGQVDWVDLHNHASASGIWEGTATYLVLVSDYVRKYSGSGIDLPPNILQASRFDGSVMYCGGNFLRVPIVPQSASLYRSQLVDSIRRGELHSGARLVMLPWLATAAAIGHKLTGSDKGIW
jgi:hypothetical protein